LSKNNKLDLGVEKLDSLIEFLVQNIEDDRINLSKKIKYGFRFYFLSLEIDIDPNSKSHSYHYRDQMELIFDNRNECIEVYGTNDTNPVVVEDKELLNKWSSKFEDMLNTNIEKKVVDIFEKSIGDCFNKNLYRQLQMKKIINDDESL
jgi:hypothetical protein